MSDDLKQLNEVHAWFAAREFGLEFTLDEDESGRRFFWADLTRFPSGRVVAPRYGRGASQADAATSARSRFEVEQ